MAASILVAPLLPQAYTTHGFPWHSQSFPAARAHTSGFLACRHFTVLCKHFLPLLGAFSGFLFAQPVFLCAFCAVRSSRHRIGVLFATIPAHTRLFPQVSEFLLGHGASSSPSGGRLLNGQIRKQKSSSQASHSACKMSQAQSKSSMLISTV